MFGSEAVCAAAMPAVITPAVITRAKEKRAIRAFAVSKVVGLSVGIL
jgi:hypothetical protein